MGQHKPIRDRGRTPVPQLVSNRFEMVKTSKGSLNPISRRVLRRRWRLSGDAKATLRGYVDHAFQAAVAYSVRGSVPRGRVDESTLADLGRRYGHGINSLRWECAGSPSSVAVDEPRSPMAGSLPPSEIKNRAYPARRTQETDDRDAHTSPRESEALAAVRFKSLKSRPLPRPAPRSSPHSYAVGHKPTPSVPGVVRRGSKVTRAHEATGPPEVSAHRQSVNRDKSGPVTTELGGGSNQSRVHGDNVRRRVAEANRRAARSPRDALHMDRFWPPTGRRAVGTFVLETGPPNNRGPTHYRLGPHSPSMRRVA